MATRPPPGPAPVRISKPVKTGTKSLENIELNHTTTVVRTLLGATTQEGHLTSIRPPFETSATCGYCKKGEQVSFSFVCTSISPQDAQKLNESAFRRSGNVFFKPLPKSCCPQFLTRLEADKFIPSRQHKRVLKKWQDFLQHGATEDKEKPEAAPEPTKKATPEPKEVGITSFDLEVGQISAALQEWFASHPITISKASVLIKQRKNQKRRSQTEHYCDIASVIFVQLTAAEKKLFTQQGIGAELFQILQKNGNQNIKLQDKGALIVASEAKALPPDPSTKRPVQEQKKAPVSAKEPCHKLEFSLSPPKYTHEKLSLFLKYQKSIHNETEADEFRFKKWLVNTPIQNTTQDGTTCGTFHYEFRLDGILVGVAVWDLLPIGLNAVYFFYDPDFSHLSIGTYCCLMEIDWVKKHQTKTFRYYYMGSYVHSCPKMNYKADYKPLDLLSLRHEWVPHAQAAPLLDLDPLALSVVPEVGAEDLEKVAFTSLRMPTSWKQIKLDCEEKVVQDLEENLQNLFNGFAPSCKPQGITVEISDQ